MRRRGHSVYSYISQLTIYFTALSGARSGRNEASPIETEPGRYFCWRTRSLIIVWRRPAFDIGKGGPDIAVREFAAEGGHATDKTGRRILRPAMFGDVEEKLIGMMPGVAGLVMRRRRQAAICEPRAPVRLAFEPDPVTGREPNDDSRDERSGDHRSGAR